MEKKWQIENYAWGELGRRRVEDWVFGHFREKESLANTEVIKDSFEFKYWTLPRGDRSHEPKKQKEATEYTYIIKGEVKGWVKIDSEKKDEIRLRTGDYIIIKPGICNNLVEEVIEDVQGITIKVPTKKGDTVRPC